MIKIVFFGTPEFSVPALEALIADPQFDVVAVVTEPEKKKGRGQVEAARSPVFEMASKHSIPTLTPKSIKKDEEVQKKINSFGADVYVVIAYGKIIPEVIFAAPPHGTVNVHYSLLPELRGPSPVQWALLEGKEKTGVTLMEIDAEMDHGRVISQEEIGIEPNDTFLTLAPRLNELGVSILTRDLPLYVAGNTQPQEQEHEKATYCKMITKEDGRVDWTQSAQSIYNRWRAFVVWPGTYTFAGETRLNLKDVALATMPLNSETGMLVVQDKKLYVRCGTGLPAQSGVLEILRVQPEGKKTMDATSFINGYHHLLEKPLL